MLISVKTHKIIFFGVFSQKYSDRAFPSDALLLVRWTITPPTSQKPPCDLVVKPQGNFLQPYYDMAQLKHIGRGLATGQVSPFQDTPRHTFTPTTHRLRGTGQSGGSMVRTGQVTGETGEVRTGQDRSGDRCYT